MPLEPETIEIDGESRRRSRSSPARAELTALDQAIGDGDHGINMKRGFEAVLGKLDAIGAQPLDEAFRTIGKTLVMTVGGASGPLYGSFFLAVGEALRGKQLPGRSCRRVRLRRRRRQRAGPIAGRREDDARCSRSRCWKCCAAPPGNPIWSSGSARRQAKRPRARRRCRRPRAAPRFSAPAASATSIPARDRVACCSHAVCDTLEKLP